MPLVIPDSTTTTGVSLERYRERLTRQIGDAHRGVVTDRATGIEAERYVICRSYRSDATPKTRFDGLYLYVRSGIQAGEQRRIIDGGYDGPNGALLVDYPFESALEIGTQIEIAALPAVPYLGIGGLNDDIDEGLEGLTLIDQVTLSAVTDTLEYSLAALPFPVKSVRAVCGPRNDTSEHWRELSRSAWSFSNDAESTVLTLWNGGYTTGQTFRVEVTRPANSWIRSAAGAWGNTTEGLNNEEEAQALYDARTVVAMTLPITLKRMAQTYPLGSPERMELTAESRDERRTAGLVKWYSSFRGSGAQRIGATGGRCG